MIIPIIMFILSMPASFIFSLAATAYFFSDLNLFIQLVIGLFILMIVIAILRMVFRRERPEMNSLSKKFLGLKLTRSRMKRFRNKMVELEERSFASAHVGRVSVFLSVLYLNNYSFEWLIGLGAYMVLVGITRLSLKRHRFFDLLTGAAIGLAAGYVSFFIMTMYIFI